MIKKFLRNNFKSIYKFYKLIKLYKNLKFNGWGMTMNTSPPWVANTKNKTLIEFNKNNEALFQLISTGEFQLTQFNKESIYETLTELKYRHYIVSYTAMLAFNSTKSRNVAEFGVCDGLTIFYCISKFKEDLNFRAYLYDSWESMQKKHLKESKEQRLIGSYSYLSLENTKKNLSKFKRNIIFNKGYIPEIFSSSHNPKEISWAHIDLNSSYPTKETLIFIYPLIEKNGVILFDDYGFDGYEDTREVIDNFLIKKSGDFIHLPTGQAYFIKR